MAILVANESHAAVGRRHGRGQGTRREGLGLAFVEIRFARDVPALLVPLQVAQFLRGIFAALDASESNATVGLRHGGGQGAVRLPFSDVIRRYVAAGFVIV